MFKITRKNETEPRFLTDSEKKVLFSNMKAKMFMRFEKFKRDNIKANISGQDVFTFTFLYKITNDKQGKKRIEKDSKNKV